MNKKEALQGMIKSLEDLDSAWVTLRAAHKEAQRATQEFCSVMEKELLNFEYYSIGDAEI